MFLFIVNDPQYQLFFGAHTQSGARSPARPVGIE
jgi:hypothetical protein